MESVAAQTKKSSIVKNQKVFFTIITPTYNRRSFLKKPIESVLAQTFFSWELIVVDDGSTDDTESFVKSFDDERIRYIFQKNQERSAARNNGIQNARGEYICFLDSDDYYLPHHLETCYRRIESENYPVAVFFGNSFQEVDGKLVKLFAPKTNVSSGLEFVLLNTIGVPRAYIHHEILKKHKFNPAITVGEDLDLWVRIVSEYPYYYFDDHTQVFVEHEDRTAHYGKRESADKNFKLRKSIIEKYSAQISPDMKKILLSNLYFGYAKHFDFVNDHAKAFRYFSTSLCIAPSLKTKEKLYRILQCVPLVRFLLK